MLVFTGIIKEQGKLIKKSAEKGARGRGMIFYIKSKLKLKPGQSVCVNGACLTVTKKTRNGFYADVINETLKRTNLGHLAAGAKINLEPSLKIGGTLDGHFVTGHGDATGKD